MIYQYDNIMDGRRRDVAGHRRWKGDLQDRGGRGCAEPGWS